MNKKYNARIITRQSLAETEKNPAVKNVCEKYHLDLTSN